VSVAASAVQYVDHRYLTVRIPWRTRWRLQWYARSDRRAGLPVGLSAESTPALAELVAEYGEVCERERTRYLTIADRLDVRLGTIATELDTLRATLDRQQQDVVRFDRPPAAEWLSRRYPGEELLADAATRERRAVTAQRSVERARAAVQETQRRLDAVLAERADLQAQLRTHADLARSHVVRAREITSRKAAVYRRALLRRHPQREDLVRNWTPELCALPAWADTEIRLPSTEPTGAFA
jgi:hypothetical protein